MHSIIRTLANKTIPLKPSSKKSFSKTTKLVNPSANRNSAPILNVLQTTFDKQTPNLRLLEISSGTGQHSAYFASHFPNIQFQPSEFDETMIGSIRSYANDCLTKNICQPIVIDVEKPYTEWQSIFSDNDDNEKLIGKLDYMLNINMIHISPFTCTEGLFSNAGSLLRTNGILITYGPYSVNGIISPQSNIDFNQMLKSRNHKWGLRDIADLQELGKSNGLQLENVIDMPANNKTCIWRKN